MRKEQNVENAPKKEHQQFKFVAVGMALFALLLISCGVIALILPKPISMVFFSLTIPTGSVGIVIFLVLVRRSIKRREEGGRT